MRNLDNSFRIIGTCTEPKERSRSRMRTRCACVIAKLSRAALAQLAIAALCMTVFGCASAKFTQQQVAESETRGQAKLAEVQQLQEETELEINRLLSSIEHKKRQIAELKAGITNTLARATEAGTTAAQAPTSPGFPWEPPRPSASEDLRMTMPLLEARDAVAAAFSQCGYTTSSDWHIVPTGLVAISRMEQLDKNNEFVKILEYWNNPKASIKSLPDNFWNKFTSILLHGLPGPRFRLLVLTFTTQEYGWGEDTGNRRVTMARPWLDDAGMFPISKIRERPHLSPLFESGRLRALAYVFDAVHPRRYAELFQDNRQIYLSTNCIYRKLEGR